MHLCGCTVALKLSNFCAAWDGLANRPCATVCVGLYFAKGTRVMFRSKVHAFHVECTASGCLEERGGWWVGARRARHSNDSPLYFRAPDGGPAERIALSPGLFWTCTNLRTLALWPRARSARPWRGAAAVQTFALVSTAPFPNALVCVSV